MVKQVLCKRTINFDKAGIRRWHLLPCTSAWLLLHKKERQRKSLKALFEEHSWVNNVVWFCMLVDTGEVDSQFLSNKLCDVASHANGHRKQEICLIFQQVFLRMMLLLSYSCYKYVYVQDSNFKNAVQIIILQLDNMIIWLWYINI